MPHFLDPLTPDEVRLAAAAVKSYFAGQPVRFNDIAMLEPPKREWVAAAAAAASSGGGGGGDDAQPTPRRRARAVVASHDEFFELDLDAQEEGAFAVSSCRPIDLSKGQPLATAEDCLLAERIARGDPRVARACARALRAISAFDYSSSSSSPLSDAELMERYVALDPWALHHCPERWYVREGGRPRRAMLVFAYEKPTARHNEYARPLPVVAAVDLQEGRVIDVEDGIWEGEEEEGEGGAAEGRGRRRLRPPPPPPAEPAAPQEQQQQQQQQCSGANTNHTNHIDDDVGQGEYAPELLGRPPRRDPPRPLRTTQPEGPSFSTDPSDPWRVLWQGWSFRIGFNAREGLVLYDVAFAAYGGGDGDSCCPRRHPMAHRLSVAEMCVPYSDPRSPYNRRCALDAGDYGLGAASVPQSACADCAGGGDVRYFSPCLSDASGEPRVVQNAVCLHEVDAGVLWKHFDYRFGQGPVRRARELILGFALTAVNYDYLFSWAFGLDGSIRLEVRLTGVLSTNRLTREEALSGGDGGTKDGLPTHGTLVAPRVVAGHHQHLFCARLDLAVGDERGGRGLAVSEVDPLPAAAVGASAAGAAGNGFTFRETVLRPPADWAGRNAAVGRVWRVSDPRRRHPRSGRPAAYELRLSSPATLLACPESSTAARRALFATKALWVTPHEDGELFPTGRFAMNSREDTGPMRRVLERARVLGRAGTGAAGATAGVGGGGDGGNDDADPVLWVTFGVTHEVRPEDYPVMPRDVCSIELRPYGFFPGGNPAVDLPPPRAADGAREVVVAPLPSKL